MGLVKSRAMWLVKWCFIDEMIDLEHKWVDLGLLPCGHRGNGVVRKDLNGELGSIWFR